MSLKIKLISCISAFILILGMFIAGVLSAQQAQVNIGGSISFNATDVYARVTGSVANAQSNPTLSELLFTANDDSSPSETALATWSNMDLDFNQTPTPIEILITVENLSTERQLMVSLEDNIVSNGLNKTFTKDNEAYVTGNTDLLPASTGENTSTTTFLVTLSVVEPNLSLENIDFGFTLNLYDETAIPSYNDFEFELDEENGTATVTNYLGSGGAVTIPSSISTRIAEDGTTEYIMGSDYTVTAIAAGSSSSGPFYSARSTLTSITIPETMKTIGNYAFYGCTALTEINYNATAANDLTSSSFVFANAGQDGEGITVNIGANVTSLPNYIFGGALSPNITTVNFTEGSVCESIGDYAFRYCDSLTSITIPNRVTSVGDNAFQSCTNLTSITIGESVTSIGNYAFHYCAALTEINYSAIAANDLTQNNHAFEGAGKDGTGIIVNIGANVRSLPSYIFSPYVISTSPNISTVNFAEGSVCESIGDYAFRYCSNLTSITIGESVTSIGNYAFYYCSGLTSITIPEGILSIGTYAFSGCDSLTSVDFGDNSQLASIGSRAFYDCSSLTSITIPENVTSLGNAAFHNCTALTEINYNATVARDLSSGSSVFMYAGQNGTGITVNIGAKVTRLPNYIFYPSQNIVSCGANITTVNFAEDSVCESIGSYAFSTCYNLTSITIPSSVTSIGSLAFWQCYALAEVYNYSNLEIANNTSNGYVGYYAKVIHDLSAGATKPDTRITVVDNMQYYNYGSDFIALAPSIGRNTLTVSLDSRTTEINQRAFYSYSNLTSITILEGVLSIGSYAFYDCSSLTSITIPDSVISIGDSAFGSCDSLTSIEVDTANENYSSEEGVLFDKDKTTLITFPGGKSETYTIPDGVTSIGYRAFSYCDNLTSITIPASVANIGDYAFQNCYGLTTATFEKDSQLIGIGSCAFQGCSRLTSITIPESVTSIGQSAFNGCNFSTVTIDNSYAYQRAGDTASACGELLADADTVYVNSALITELGTAANSYLNENFGQPTDNGNGYYVYTRNA